MNRAFTEITGYPAEVAVGRTPRILKSGRQDRAVYEELWRTILAGRPWRGRLWNRRRDGGLYLEEQTITPVAGEHGELTHFIAVKQDVTDRVRLEEELREAEARYRNLVERLPAVVYLGGLDERAGTLYVSPQVEALTGYAPAAWLADPRLVFQVVHPEDRDGLREARRHLLRTGQPTSFEGRVVTRDGREVWVRDDAVLLRDEEGRPVAIQGVVLDITEARRAREELDRTLEALRRADGERRRLLARVVRAQEDERQRIAGDIHDDSVQAMTAVGLRLAALARSLADPGQAERLRALEASVNEAIARLRNLIFELRPASLDREGLATALRELLERTFRDSPVDLDLRVDLPTEPPPAARLLAFRVAQEAVRNVWKHARASRVEVAVRAEGEGLRVTVADDGVGFSAEDLAAPVPGHLGIPTMRERAEQAGGWLRVRSSPGGRHDGGVLDPLGGGGAARRRRAGLAAGAHPLGHHPEPDRREDEGQDGPHDPAGPVGQAGAAAAEEDGGDVGEAHAAHHGRDHQEGRGPAGVPHGRGHQGRRRGGEEHPDPGVEEDGQGASGHGPEVAGRAGARLRRAGPHGPPQVLEADEHEEPSSRQPEGSNQRGGGVPGRQAEGEAEEEQREGPVDGEEHPEAAPHAAPGRLRQQQHLHGARRGAQGHTDARGGRGVGEVHPGVTPRSAAARPGGGRHRAPRSGARPRTRRARGCAGR